REPAPGTYSDRPRVAGRRPRRGAGTEEPDEPTVVHRRRWARNRVAHRLGGAISGRAARAGALPHGRRTWAAQSDHRWIPLPQSNDRGEGTLGVAADHASGGSQGK